MTLIIILTIVFLVILLLPFLLASASIGKNRDLKLKIRSDNARDPRYFAKSFTAMMEKALETYDGSGTIQLSRPNKLATAPFPDEPIDGIALIDGDYAADRQQVFREEVFVRGDAAFAPQSSLRAVAGLDDVVLNQDSEIIRWIDARNHLIIRKGCDLGISATSAHFLSIDVDCRFCRLYAPIITVGAETEPTFMLPKAPPKKEGEIARVDKVEIEEVIETDLITHHSLVIEFNGVVLGSVKSRGDIRVCDGAVIMGNLVADGTIVLEDNVYVGGTVFSQESVYVGRNCQVGKPYEMKSLVAQDNVILCAGACIFGYVTCERGGMTVTYDEFINMTSEKY
ncbi:MAG: polymer-forming cytoskeletal protein [Lachnospiraceae bacterium]|nr:polymer-forming cytoskeletal protein [Lachnospiraceae bacterium]